MEKGLNELREEINIIDEKILRGIEIRTQILMCSTGEYFCDIRSGDWIEEMLQSTDDLKGMGNIWREIIDISANCRQQSEKDNEIVMLLESRQKIVEEVGILKGVIRKPVRDYRREEELMKNLIEKCTNPLLKKRVNKIWSIILQISREKQENIIFTE